MPMRWHRRRGSVGPPPLPPDLDGPHRPRRRLSWMIVLSWAVVLGLAGFVLWSLLSLLLAAPVRR